jgi:hypothetical protein
MRFDANRANNTRDFGRVSAAFRVSSNLNPCAYFGAIGDWAWGAGAPPGSTSSHRLCLPQGTATFFVIPRWLETQPVIEALVLAAADVLFDPPLLLSQHVLGLLLPVPVGRPTRLHGVRTAFKETGHPGGEEFLVGVGGDVVSGVGAVVVVGDDAAQQRGGLTAGAAARDVHPGLGSLCSWSPSSAIRSYRAPNSRS